MAGVVIAPQKYRLQAPWNDEQVEQLDEMLQDLFDGLRNSALGSNTTLTFVGAIGDVLIINPANVVSRVTAPLAGKVLRSAGVNTIPAYSTFTVPDTFAQGDILYCSAANTLIALAKSTSATRYLSNTGSSNNPLWAQVDLTTGVTGVLPPANGGSGWARGFMLMGGK